MAQQPGRRIGLVIGGGGPVGAGFHRGVLAAMQDVIGFDARGAEVIVGTSSGATTSGLLRAGFSATDLAAADCGRAPSSHAQELLLKRARAEGSTRARGQRSRSTSVSQRWAPWISTVVPASGRGVVTSARRQGARHPGAVLGALLPAGRVPTVTVGGPLDRLFCDGWPDDRLWICAVRIGDGSRVLFGRHGDPVTNVPTAVAASCALPGWFVPVAVDNERYVDGAVWSATSADVLAGEGLDVVVIIAPLSGGSSPLHRWQRGQLRLEVDRLRSTGSEVVVIEPKGADARAMGWNIMDRRRRPAVTRHVRRSVTQRLTNGDLSALSAAVHSAL